MEYCLVCLLPGGVPSRTLGAPAAAVQLHVSKPATAPCAVALTVLWQPGADAAAAATGGGGPPGARGRPAAPAAPAPPTVLAHAAGERLTLPLAALQGVPSGSGVLYARIEFAKGGLGAYVAADPSSGHALHTHVPFNLRLDTIGWGGLPDELLLGALLPLLRALLGAAAAAALLLLLLLWRKGHAKLH
jgi:hypothetical protein